MARARGPVQRQFCSTFLPSGREMLLLTPPVSQTLVQGDSRAKPHQHRESWEQSTSGGQQRGRADVWAVPKMLFKDQVLAEGPGDLRGRVQARPFQGPPYFTASVTEIIQRQQDKAANQCHHSGQRKMQINRPSPSLSDTAEDRKGTRSRKMEQRRCWYPGYKNRKNGEGAKN